ncbi:MAG: YihY/virulence factor BrkB family protein [Desulfobacteraceae bacterium]
MNLGLAGLRVAVLAVWGLIRNEAMVRAANLAYYTMLALVPLMALMFAVFKGLGLQHLLADYLLERLAPGSHDFAHQILDYIENTDVAALGAMGVASLLVTLVLVMNNIERALNLTWGVEQTRPWRRRISDYFSIFLLLPIMVAVAGTFSSAFLGLPEVKRWLSTLSPGLYYWATSGLASLVILWVAFSFIYLVIPNTRVNLLSAVIGGMVGGSLWELARWLFIYYQSTKEGTVYYDVIYGAFFHLLFLVLWVYYSWVVVLIGSEVACAHQNQEQLSRELRQPASGSEPVDEYLALAVLVAIARPFYLQKPLLSQEDLSQTLSHDHDLSQRVVKSLEDINLITQVITSDNKAGPRFLPRRPLAQIRLEDVLVSLRQKRTEALSLALAGDHCLAEAVKNLVEDTTPTQRQDLTCQDLIQTLE